MLPSRSVTVTTFQNELRSPLKTILGMVDFLSKSPLTAEQREYVDYIFSSAKNLLSLADYLSAESSNVYGCCFEEIMPYAKTINSSTVNAAPTLVAQNDTKAVLDAS